MQLSSKKKSTPLSLRKKTQTIQQIKGDRKRWHTIPWSLASGCSSYWRHVIFSPWIISTGAWYNQVHSCLLSACQESQVWCSQLWQISQRRTCQAGPRSSKVGLQASLSAGELWGLQASLSAGEQWQPSNRPSPGHAVKCESFRLVHVLASKAFVYHLFWLNHLLQDVSA